MTCIGKRSRGRLVYLYSQRRSRIARRSGPFSSLIFRNMDAYVPFPSQDLLHHEPTSSRRFVSRYPCVVWLLHRSRTQMTSDLRRNCGTAIPPCPIGCVNCKSHDRPPGLRNVADIMSTSINNSRKVYVPRWVQFAQHHLSRQSLYRCSVCSPTMNAV